MATRLPRMEEKRWLLSDHNPASSPNTLKADKDDKIRKLEKELSDQFQEAYKLRRGHAVQEQQLADATQRAAHEAARAKKTTASLQKELKAAEDQIGELQSTLEDLKLERRIERASFMKESQSYQAKCSVLGMELDARDEDLAGAEAQVEFCRMQLSETQAESQCELANLDDALQAAEAETAVLELVLADAQAEKAALAKKLSLAQQQLTLAQEELAAAQEEEAITACMRLEELDHLQAESAARMAALAQAQDELARANVHHADQAACLRRAQSNLQMAEAEKAGLLEELAAARESEKNTVVRLREEREESIAAELREIDSAIREGLKAEDSAMLNELKAMTAPQEYLAVAEACRREELRALEEVLASFDEALATGTRISQPASKQDAKTWDRMDQENGADHTMYATEGQANSSFNEGSDTPCTQRKAALKQTGKKRQKLNAENSAKAREEALSFDNRIPCPDTEAFQKQAAGNSAYVEAQSNKARKSQDDQAAQFSDPNEMSIKISCPEDPNFAAYLLRAQDHITTLCEELDAQGIEPSTELVQDIMIQAFVAARGNQSEEDGAAVQAEKEKLNLSEHLATARATLNARKDKEQQESCNCKDKQCFRASLAERESEISKSESNTASKAALAEPGEGRKALRNRITALEKDRARVAQKLQATEAERDTLARKLKEAEQNASKSQVLWTKEKRRLQNKLAEASTSAVPFQQKQEQSGAHATAVPTNKLKP